MIRVKRPESEPSAVTAQRKAGLKLALAAYDATNPSSLLAVKKTLTSYDSGKEELYRAQHRKCAYFEGRVGLGSNPVEHFRPKKEAWRHVRDESAKVVDADRYWWLTWNWENVLFACVT